MKIPINLASQPFRRDRALLVASVAVSLLLVGTLGALISLILLDRTQLADVRHDVDQLNRQIRKVAAEQAITGFARGYGVDAVALRLAWVYGPGRRTPTTLAQLLQAGVDGRAFMIDDAPSTVTQYVHVEDVIEGLLAAGRAANLPRLVYNISAGPGCRFDDLVALVRQLALHQLKGWPRTLHGRATRNRLTR